MNILKVSTLKFLTFVRSFSLRSKLKNKEFTIISNNCWGGFVYRDLGIKYKSPFVGLFIFAPDYIRLLKNLKKYLECELKFITDSKYKHELTKNETFGTYPIGLLDDVEIHFMHFKSEKEAKEKWDRRVKRISWDNLYVKFCDRDLCTYDLLKEFDNLKFKNKVIFTAKLYSSLKSSVQMKEFENQLSVGNEGSVYKKYFNVVEWINK